MAVAGDRLRGPGIANSVPVRRIAPLPAIDERGGYCLASLQRAKQYASN